MVVQVMSPAIREIVPDRKRDRTVPFFDYGFDHPDIAGLEETLDSARHAFAAFVALNDADLKQSDYATFEPQGPPFQKRGLAISSVPVLRTAEHGGGLWFAMDGRYSRTAELSAASKLTVVLDAVGGVLITFDQPLDEAGTGTIGTVVDFTWDDPSYGSWSNQQVPEGVSVRARRLAVHILVDALKGLGERPLVDVVEDDVIPGKRQDVRDAVAHLAGADDADAFDTHAL